MESNLELVSVVVAILALVVAIWVHTSQAQLSKDIQKIELDVSRSIAAAHVKPLIAIVYSNYERYVSLELKNLGMGTAIIDDVKIHSEGKKGKSVGSFVKKGDAKDYEYFTFADSGEVYLAVGDVLRLIRVADGTELARRKAELRRVSVEVAYKDLFGNRQPTAIRHGG